MLCAPLFFIILALHTTGCGNHITSSLMHWGMCYRELQVIPVIYVIIYCILCSFIQYHSTSLERGHKHDLLTEVDLGVPIDLILPETYSRTEAASKFSICSCTMAVLQPCTNFKLLRYNATLQKITYIYIIKC